MNKFGGKRSFCFFPHLIIQMEMSGRQLDERIQSSRETYKFGSQQQMAGIFTLKAMDWLSHLWNV